MKIIVMSDSHGYSAPIQKILALHQDADLFFHLGDGEREIMQLTASHPWFDEKLIYLKGNCDTGGMYFGTRRQVFHTTPYGHRIFAAHGDYYHVKFSTIRMVQEARRNNCDIILFGHTHAQHNTYEDGIYILNPGSVSCPRDGNPPSYAVLSISEKGVLTNIVKL